MGCTQLLIGSDGLWAGPREQTLASNDVKLTRWQRPYPGYFGFTFEQWEEVEAHRPSLYTLSVVNMFAKSYLFIHSEHH